MSLLVLVLMMSISSAAAVGFRTSDLFNADGSTYYDSKTFVGKQLVLEIESSSIMVACWNFSNPNCDENPTYDACYAASQSDFDKCKAFDPAFLNSTGFTRRDNPGIAGPPLYTSITTCADARYYKNCDGLGNGNLFGVTQKQYFVFAKRKFDCNEGVPSAQLYAAEGYISGAEHSYSTGLSCPVGTFCSEQNDDIWLNTLGTIPNPCGGNDWATCTKDSQCSSGRCDDGKCSPCNSRECTHANNQVCVGNNQVYATNQLFCQPGPGDGDLFIQCTTANHTGCEQRDIYSCTNQGGLGWKWRVCDVKGCVSDQCVTEVPQICVDTGVIKVGI